MKEESLHTSYEELLCANQKGDSNKRKLLFVDGGQECSKSVMTDLEEQANGNGFELDVAEHLRYRQSEIEHYTVEMKKTDFMKTCSNRKSVDSFHERNNMSTPSTSSSKSETLVFKNQVVRLLNDYNDPAYDTTTFSNLFWTESEGHIHKRSVKQVKVSFESKAKWLINHHGRK